jgi:peptidoglycan/LPS O-acetylase OafA/YrhL
MRCPPSCETMMATPPAALLRQGWFLSAPQTRAGQVDALDGLRGLAVLVVLGSHFSNAGLLPSPGLSGSGKLGVYLFFALSAFLLTRILLRRPPAGFADARLWADYALRRVLRIWPLYLVVLLASWVATLAGIEAWHYRMETPALLRHLALLEGRSVLWSIPVEFKYYLWLPLVALGLAWMAARRWPWWAEAGAVAVAVVLASLAWPPAQAQANDVRLGPYLAVFLCGAYAARVDQRLASLPRREAVWGCVAVVALAAATLMVPAVWAAASGAGFDPQRTHRWFIAAGIAWSALLLAVLHGPAWLRAPFSSRPMRWAGVVSFSAYLWHMPVIDALRHAGWTGFPGAVLLALVAVAVASALSYLAFERPWRDVRVARRGARPVVRAGSPAGTDRGPPVS